MKSLFTLILAVAIGTSVSYAQQVTSTTGKNHKTEAEAQQRIVVKEHTATTADPAKQVSTQNKQQITTRDVEKQSNQEINAQISRKKAEIEAVKADLHKQSTDPKYNSAAAKARLDKLRKELKELKSQTL